MVCVVLKGAALAAQDKVGGRGTWCVLWCVLWCVVSCDTSIRCVM